MSYVLYEHGILYHTIQYHIIITINLLLYDSIQELPDRHQKKGK